ncbi:hypothetical protein TcasGA2_TC034196 [Tribolium castaneum]|uniref:Uncharacterized protein n=1 Tax=Tribolium castaneum TaxID=7070 RepID=A0A139WCL3_TRICA|nr:PREDICTED: uncharacterized protein LOC103314147 isoform X1 [Tribolium castaneum]KYB25708.1 hypothetical protein TcasGA2_TC034196 [Tribolium castaneum]|eukprot:XP_008197476.1 PREDICTED: uncharacterized protein LOC103314147 isoform X1 [Tribolium castaneum]
MARKDIRLELVKLPIIELLSAEQHGKIFSQRGKYFVEVLVCATITEASGSKLDTFIKYTIDDGTSCMDCFVPPGLTNVTKTAKNNSNMTQSTDSNDTKFASSQLEHKPAPNFQLGDTLFVWGKLRVFPNDNIRKLFATKIQKCYKLEERINYWEQVL